MVRKRLALPSSRIKTEWVVEGSRKRGKVSVKHCLGWSVCSHESGLDLAISFVVREEKKLVLEDGSSYIYSKLVLMVGPGRNGAEVVPRAHLVVAYVLVELSMEAVGARFCNDVDYTRVRPEVGHEEAVMDLKLVNCSDRKVERRIAGPTPEGLYPIY